MKSISAEFLEGRESKNKTNDEPEEKGKVTKLVHDARRVCKRTEGSSSSRRRNASEVNICFSDQPGSRSFSRDCFALSRFARHSTHGSVTKFGGPCRRHEASEAKIGEKPGKVAWMKTKRENKNKQS